MDRRGFISVLGIASVGILASPSLANAKAQLPYTVLPESIQHVRHGLFQMSRVKHRFLPSWIKVYQPHRFLKNGFAVDLDDMILHAFSIDSQKVSITKTVKETWIGLNESSVNISNNEVVNFDISGYHIRILKGKNVFQTAFTGEHICFLLQGACKFNNQRLKEGEFICENAEGYLVEMTSNESMAILFTRL